MKFRVAIALVIIIASAPLATAQEASINSPVAPPAEVKAITTRIIMERDCSCAVIQIAYQDNGSNETRRVAFAIPASDIQAFATAIISPRTGETGVATRRLNFRALGYLVDSGRLSGVTLLP